MLVYSRQRMNMGTYKELLTRKGQVALEENGQRRRTGSSKSRKYKWLRGI